MKFIQASLKAVVVVIAAIAAFACQKTPADGGSSLNETLEFMIDVEDITLTSAKIKVTHNGQKSDTWYGFLTEDISADEDRLIEEAAEAYMNGESAEGLRRSKSYVTVLKELKPGTSYRYIAFGLSADGKIYGNAASVEFETRLDDSGSGSGGGTSDPSVDGMKINPAWTVNYVGEGVLDGEEYDHVVTVNSTDKNTYAITVVYASLWNLDDLYDMTVILCEDLVAYIEEFNDYYGTSYTVADALFTGSASDAFDLYPGYYMAVAIGITPEGKPSGLYAVSDVFEVKEAIPTEEYKSWLGDWTIVGENDVEFTVTLSRHINNRSFWMYGWEGFEDIPVDVEYSEDRNDLTFYAQLVQENYYLEDYGVTANMYFLGGDVDDNFYTVVDGNYGIAIAGILDDGQRALVRYGVNQPGYPKFISMFYSAEVDGNYMCFNETADLPTFRGIAGMYPAAETKTTKASLEQRRSKAMIMPLSRKTSRFYKEEKDRREFIPSAVSPEPGR